MAPSFFFDCKKKVLTYHKAGQGYAKTNTTRSNEGSIPHPPADSQSHPAECFHAAASATRDLSRVFTPWSHVVALIYQQLTKTESLNGVCDAARLHAFKKRHSSLRSGNCASADSRESYEQASG